MKTTIKKAVFPIAGFGTRFLPATKASPKELLPIIDKPLIQYAVEEAVAAGINELIFITNSNKHSIEDHFDTNFELESLLIARGQMELAKMVHDVLPPGVSAAYIRQQSPAGLGDAILCARHYINNEPFAVLLADDLIKTSTAGCLHEMVTLYKQIHANIIAVEQVTYEDTKKYGIVSLADEPCEQAYQRMVGIVEKPNPVDAPSNWGAIGRYILQPSIFKALLQTKVGANGELQLTDAIAALLVKEPTFAYYLKGRRYDCGSKLGYLQAVVEYGCVHAEVGPAFRAFLQGLTLG